MNGPFSCKGCPRIIYFDMINGKSRVFEDEFGITPHLCKGFRKLNYNTNDYFTYENLLKAVVVNQQMIKEQLDTISTRLTKIENKLND